MPVSFLVIHYVGAEGGAEDNARYYANTPNLRTSAHYFVGHGGEIFQSVSDADTAWHCGTTGTYRHPDCRNSNSIGIELCCHRDRSGKWYFEKATVEQAVELVRALREKYGVPAGHVVRHYDVTGKRCPAPYVEDAAAWQTFLDRLEEHMTTEQAMKIIKEKTKLSDATLDFLWNYRWGDELLLKLAGAMEEN